MVQRNAAGNSRSSQSALLPGVLFLTLAALLCGFALYRASLPPYLKPLFFRLSAALLVAAAAFLSSFLHAWARGRGPHLRRQIDMPQIRPLPRLIEETRRRLYRAANAVIGVDWKGDWLPLGVAALLSAGALAAAAKGWRGGPLPPVSADPWIVGILTLLAFPMLVLERRFAVLAARKAGDAPALIYLVRLLLVAPLLLALSFVLRWFALPFAQAVEHAVVIFCALVAGEILLRCASYLFLPLPPLAARGSHAVSLIASALRLQRPSLKGFSASVSRQFGIDLGRSWALMFIRRATVPMIGGLLLAGWLMTGVSTLSISERAVAEIFGAPVTVFHPGLHVSLPWPFGRLKPVEYGVVHQIPIAFLDEEIYGKPKDVAQVAEKSTIEGPQPASADRLWEASRPTEASYLVASNQNGRENFEAINIDLRIAYRIGLSDAAAMSAAYSVESPENLIRAAAGRMLARYFARYTLAAIMGQDREAFIRNFQKELQQRLSTVTGSVEILSVVIETIHPPAGVAEAYQQVQAAAIDAVTKVANARGDAARDVHQAEANATEARDGATAAAAETIADAKVGTALLAGDVQAYREGGQAFLFEKRLGVLGAAITPDTPVTILDARVSANQFQLLQAKPPGAGPGQ